MFEFDCGQIPYEGNYLYMYDILYNMVNFQIILIFIQTIFKLLIIYNIWVDRNPILTKNSTKQYFSLATFYFFMTEGAWI